MWPVLLDGIWHDGVHAFAAEYLGAGRRVPFCGREGELSDLEEHFRGGVPYALVCAEAGRGKSALVLRAADALSRTGEAVAWLPISLRFGTSRSALADELLTARVVALGGTPGHWADQLGAGGSWSGRRVLLVLDGLDEFADESLLDALARFTPAPTVRILVTARRTVSRDAAGWARRLGWTRFREFPLAPLGLPEVARLVSAEAPRARAADVMLRTGGDPLLVRLCVEALRDGLTIPAGSPEALVDAWWEEQRRALEAPAGELARRALAAVGLARGVVPWASVAEVLGIGEVDARGALAPFDRFLVDVPGEGVAFAHPRFADVARARPEAGALLSRFSACARDARMRPDPGRYWLEFGAAHLTAGRGDGAGDREADLEAWDALTSLQALAAWRRLEGGTTGFLSDVRTALDRIDDALESEWANGGSSRSGPLLRRQARLLTLDAALTRAELATEPRLRAALVSHGLRSARSALASVAGLAPGSRFESVQALLPVLPDALLPSLVALDAAGRWPRADVVRRLVASGAVADAVAHLLGDPAFLADTLVEIAPLLAPAEVSSCRKAILQAHRPSSGGEDGEDPDRERATLLGVRLSLLRLVPREKAGAELDAIAKALSKLPPAALFYDGYYGERDPRSGIAEAYARQGRTRKALSWLERIRAAPVPWEPEQHLPGGADGHWLDEVIRVHADVAALLGPKAGAPVTKWLSGVPAGGKLGAAAWVTLTACLPESRFLEAAWREAERSVRSGLGILFSRPDAHPLLVERTAASLLARLERELDRMDSGPAKARAEALRALDDLALALGGRPHPDASRLLPLAVRWLGHLPGGRSDQATAFARLLVVNATDDARKAAFGPLLAEAAGAGAPLSALEGWEAIVPFDARRRILARRAAAPVELARGDEWVKHLVGSALELRAAGLPEGAALLAEVAARCAGDDAQLLAACAAAADDASQAVLAARVLAVISPGDAGASWAFVDQVAALSALVAGLRDPALKARFAREALGRIPPGRWPNRFDWWKPVFEALPPCEIEAAFRRLAPRGTGEWPIDGSVPASLRSELFARRSAALARRKDDAGGAAELWWASFEVPEGDGYRARFRARLRKELPRLPDGGADYDPRHEGWISVGTVVPSSDAEELLFFGRWLARIPLSTVQGLGRRAAELVRAGAEPGEELLSLGFACVERTRSQHLGYHLAVDVALAEARLRRLDGDAALRLVLERSGPPASDSWWGSWIADAFRAAGWEAALARHVASLAEPADRFRAWRSLWPALSAGERTALGPALEAAARDDRSGTSWEPLSHELGASLVRTLWRRETRRPARGYRFPVDVLRLAGGDEAAIEWARGVAEAFDPFFRSEARPGGTGTAGGTG